VSETYCVSRSGRVPNDPPDADPGPPILCGTGPPACVHRSTPTLCNHPATPGDRPTHLPTRPRADPGAGAASFREEAATMPELATSLMFDRANRRLLVDGEEFPWFTTNGVDVAVDDVNGPTFVTLTLVVAGPVTITDRDR
jgi:hypothetical protein